jgi:PAS domain S-box-containing protein
MTDTGSLAEAYLQQSPACHWIQSADGRFVEVFGDCCTFFGCNPSEMVGRAPELILTLEQASQWRGRIKRVLNGERLVLRERHPNGTWLISMWQVGRLERPETGASGPPSREAASSDQLLVAGLAREMTAWGSAEDELRHTVLGALKAQEYVRTSASRFLHDSVGQTLTALGLRLDLVRMDIEGSLPETTKLVGEIQEIIGDMMESVRNYSYELNPSTVERAGLRPALDRFIERLRTRYSGTLRVNVDPSLKLDPKYATALYQIAQESIENAVQHSSCSGIEISVKSTRTGTILEVRDNGRGFDPADVLAGRRGLGLLSMEHYAAEAGLELSITSTLESGTTVRAVTPGAVER